MALKNSGLIGVFAFGFLMGIGSCSMIRTVDVDPDEVAPDTVDAMVYDATARAFNWGFFVGTYKTILDFQHDAASPPPPQYLERLCHDMESKPVVAPRTELIELNVDSIAVYEESIERYKTQLTEFVGFNCE